MGTLGQDFRFGLRMLRKNPGFTAIAIVTLALAIGANTAIFSVVYPVLLRPLPFRQPDRLVTIGETRQQNQCCAYSASYPDFLDWRSSAKSFESLAGYASDPWTITGNGDPKALFCAQVTANFFSTLGVSPMLGRDFAASEELPDGQGPTVALLSYNFWKTDFAADPKAVGRVIRLDNKPVTIIGVLPRNFSFDPAGIVPLWVPLHLNGYGLVRGARWFSIIGRLAPGVTLQQARAEMGTISAQLARQYPQENARVTVNMAPIREQIVGDVRPLLLVLFGAVAFVLLIACANVANLLLSRSLDRRQEFAIRTALGANQLHLVLQLLIESLMLSAAGAVIGFGAAWIGVSLMVHSIPESQLVAMPYLKDVGISFPTLGFAAGISLLTAILFGLGPALSVPQTPITDVLKEESRGGTSGTRTRLRNILVTGEIAISLVLLVAGGLMLQSLRALLRQDPGFEPANTLTFMLDLTGASYPVGTQWPFANPNGLRFAHQVLDRVRNLPGVEGASVTSGIPATENDSTNRFAIQGQAVVAGEEESAVSRRVDADYFSVMKMPMVAGRAFTRDDVEGRPLVVVVNQAWVKRFLSPRQDPMGTRIRLTRSPQEPFREIVGVIADVAEVNLAAPPPPAMYIPLDQDSGYSSYLNFVIRTRDDPARMVGSARSVVRTLDPQLALIQPQSIAQLVERSPAVFLRRYPFYFIGSFAALALILATIGLYGLISYSVLQRNREIGIRLALGASREQILKIMIRQGVMAAVIGVAVGVASGLLIGLLLSKVMSTVLYGVRANDWVTYTVVSLLLLLIALTASYIPARRATQIDPIIALRNE